jgi:hypothetical protein
MIQFEFDHLHIRREVLLYIQGAYMQTHAAGASGVHVVRFNYHFPPPERT